MTSLLSTSAERVGLRRRAAAIPSADIGALGGAVARTRVVRIALALALVASLFAAFLLSRGFAVRESGFLPGARTGVVVIDMSASIGEAANRRIAGVIENAVKSDESTGLILFSDSAYELVPPTAPGNALQPMLRFFRPRGLSAAERRRLQAGAGLQGVDAFPRNPWQNDFRGGTRISAGLRLAQEMLRRDHVHDGSVLLVSDLAYSTSDESDLTQILLQYRSSGLPLRIVPLFPSKENRDFFSRLLGADALISWKKLRGAIGPRASVEQSGALPIGLIVVGSLAALLLALNELHCARLVVPRRTRA
jgi:Mg-chelatase subunit ChlD